MTIGNRQQQSGNRKQLKLVGCALGAILFSLCGSADAQPPAKVARIGFLSSTGDVRNPGPSVEAFRRGLRDLGYIEQKNIVVEYRYAEGKQDRLPEFVTELADLKVDVLVLTALTAVRAAKQVTKTIPIVMVILSDPVATGLVDSLARPGGNITGISRLSRELGGKRLELLQEAIPGVSRVGVIWDADAPGTASAFHKYETAARALNIELQSLPIKRPKPDLENIFRTAVKHRLGAVATINNSLLRRYSKQIAELAIKNRLGSLCEGSDCIEAGGLISYSANDADNYSRAAVYVDKILNGAKPGNLPVEQPTKFDLVINLKTAKQIGLTIPPNVLARADRVIK
jgi:putative tryptophan/tyrosine transport system substrate-binding protein